MNQDVNFGRGLVLLIFMIACGAVAWYVFNLDLPLESRGIWLVLDLIVFMVGTVFISIDSDIGQDIRTTEERARDDLMDQIHNVLPYQLARRKAMSEYLKDHPEVVEALNNG